MILRPYQEQAINTTRAKIAAGVRRILLTAPTGAGKTCIAAGIVLSAVAKGKRVLFLAHRRELIDQTVNKLVDAGVPNLGVIMAGNKLRNASAPVQVASIQTLIRRELPPADLIIIDEAHRANARSYLSVVANYPDATIIGLTATPERTDGKGLDDLFDDMVTVETVPNLIKQGFLIKPTYYVGPTADLSGVRTTHGDYDEHQLAEAMDRPKLTGDIITNWKRLANGKPTAVFAVNVAHAEHLVAEFRAAGVSAAMVCGKTPRAQREAIIADWREGYIQVVVNILVFVEGFDFPGMECVVLARPTQSVSLYLQAVGRVMRPAPGKTSALVLDHAGCYQLHGLPHIEREWTLEGMAKKREAGNLKVCECGMAYESQPRLWLVETQPRLRKAFYRKVITILCGSSQERGMDICPNCGAASCLVCAKSFTPKIITSNIDGIAWESFAFCPSCHARYVEEFPHLNTQPRISIPSTTDDLLVEVDENFTPTRVIVLNDYKALLREARRRGYRRGWVWHKLNEKYDEAVLRDSLPRHTANWWRTQA
ncbi:MAG: DEAD/DEAH box helicase family protein [Candidatus Roseilinea sp.]|uniref:DEAD/DEAH box helicase family protein n=1 Tax=Candidatus Roseilinea sp. TaxID=2838777 RepID=UPI00404B104E